VGRHCNRKTKDALPVVNTSFDQGVGVRHRGSAIPRLGIAEEERDDRRE